MPLKPDMAQKLRAKEVDHWVHPIISVLCFPLNTSPVNVNDPLGTGVKKLVNLHKEDYGDVAKYILIDYFETTGRYAEARKLTRFFN